MAHYQNQHGGVHRTDAYGNPVEVRRDEYGDPIFHHTGTTGTATTTAGHGTTAAGTYVGAPGAGTDIGTGGHLKEHHGVSGMLHRCGSSSSSSSSEDEGQGGRRKKKGLKEKIPGVGHKEDKPHAASTTTPGGYHEGEEHHEKKGIMEKIKDKLPGHHHEHH